MTSKKKIQQDAEKFSELFNNRMNKKVKFLQGIGK